MNEQKPRPANGHPIQIAARRSGLTPDVIRAWERRYHAVEPFRSKTNRRLYTEEDIEKLFLLSQVTRAGRRIGDVAGLALERLRKLVEEDDEAAVRVGKLPVTEARERSGEQYVDTAMAFLKQLDWAGMESLLTEASVTLSTPVLMEQLLTPLLHRVGDGWQRGSLRIAHEHMASAMVRTLLGNLRNSGHGPRYRAGTGGGDPDRPAA